MFWVELSVDTKLDIRWSEEPGFAPLLEEAPPDLPGGVRSEMCVIGYCSGAPTMVFLKHRGTGRMFQADLMRD